MNKFCRTLLATAFLMAPVSLAQEIDYSKTAAPVQAGGVMTLDLPDSSAKSVSINIVQGRFADFAVGELTLTGEGIDFRNGTLSALRADIKNGDFENLLVERMLMTTPGFSFDTMQLMNNKTFVLHQPVTASVTMDISEAGLNRFLTNRQTLDRIEKAIQKQTAGLKLITFANPSLALLSGNRIKLNVTGIIAQGMAVPIEMNGRLALKQGQVQITNMTLASSGTDVPLPVDVSGAFEKKLNEQIDFKKLGKDRLVIYADQLSQTRTGLHIKGHATLTRLKFGA